MNSIKEGKAPDHVASIQNISSMVEAVILVQVWEDEAVPE